MMKYLYLVLKDRVGISLKEHLIHRHVKRWNHFLRVRHQLTVEITVELAKMLTVEVEKRLANDTYLWTT